jgi:hypothetical protein
LLEHHRWRRGAPTPSAYLLPLALPGLTALAVAGCGVQDVDRTQPDKVPKCIFFQEGCDSAQPLSARTPTQFYFNQTVIDVPATSDIAFVGDTNFQDTHRVIFDIQEDLLYVYRAYPWLTAAKPGQGNGGDDSGRPGGSGPQGVPVAIYPIKSHFDVQRQYNPATGEQTNVIEENTSDRPWFERAYMRVDWSDNRVANFNFTMSTVKGSASRVVPQEDGSRDLGKERAQIGADYIDFVQQVALEASTIPGSEAWFGFPVPTCWLYSKAHTDCQGGIVKVRNSFARVETSNYQPVEYSDSRLNKFGAFRTERYTYDGEYGVVEPGVRRLANRWNLLKPGADCYAPEAPLPYGTCQASDLRTIVYYVAEEHPAHLVDAAVALGDAWDAVFKRAVAEATQRPAAELEGTRLVRVCPHNPVLAGDPAECGEAGLNPQIGDIRYSFVYYVPEAHESSPLGFGPSNVDPLTGEVLSATAYFYGAPGRWLARRTLDLFKVQEGLLTKEDLGTGAAVQARLPYPDSRSLRPQTLKRLDKEKVRAVLAENRVMEKAQRLRALVQSGEAQHDEREGKLARLRDSALDELAVTEEMRQAFGQGVVGAAGAEAFESADAISNYLAPEFFGLYEEQQAFLRHGPNGRHIHMADEYLEERYLELFRELKDRFLKDGVLDEAAAMDYVEARAFVDTMLHEVGHTLGMMHNFAGSADAMNFERRWWDLKAQAGMVEGKRPVPEWDIEDEAGFDAALQAGMRALQSSTSMEYMSTYGTDLTPGLYDVAWVKYVYLDAVEVFDTEHPDVSIDRERAKLLQRGALHYTFYPELISDAATYQARADALYRRKTVGFKQTSANPLLVEVPYRFCGDSYAGAAADCERWDQGVDNFERTQKRVLDYQNYYWFNAFKRERLAFGTDVYGYVSYLYGRVFSPMLDQYKHWVNEELIVRADQPCVWWEDGQRREEADRATADACGLAGFVGSAEAINLLASVINTPDVGCYARLQPGCYQTPATNTSGGGLSEPGRLNRVSADPAYCDTFEPLQPEDYENAAQEPPFGRSVRVGKLKIVGNSPFMHLEDTTGCALDDAGEPTFEIRDMLSGELISEPAQDIGLGVAKPSRSLYDRERYGYNFYWKPVVMGSWWEKWMAVKALSDPYTDFKGVDAASDSASYLIALTTLFGEEINNVVAGAVLEDAPVYGRVIHQGEVHEVPVLDVFGSSIFAPSRARDPLVDPDQEYTFRLVALMNAAYQSSYITDDYEFAETLKVGRTFSLSDVELPADLKDDPERFQSVRDPVTGELWWAVRVERSLPGRAATPIHSTAYEMIRRVKDRYFLGGAEGPGTELLPGVAEWRPRGDLRFLNIIRGTGDVFGDAFISSGDLGF